MYASLNLHSGIILDEIFRTSELISLYCNENDVHHTEI
jgi:hypothetical protein